MHCEWLSQHDRMMIARRIAKVDAVICCSDHVRRQFLAVFPEHRDKSHVVFNGANVEQILCRPTTWLTEDHRNDSAYSSSVGSRRKKAFMSWSKPSRKLPRPRRRATLELIGAGVSLPQELLVGLSRDPHVRTLEQFYRGDYLSEMKRRIPKGLEDRVLLHGAIPHEAVAGALPPRDDLRRVRRSPTPSPCRS